jgi:hypothetical protein
LRIVASVWLAAAIVTGLLTYPTARSTITSVPRTISASELEPFEDMYRADRAKYGFSAIDTSAQIKLERRTGRDAEQCGYDAMLHMCGPKVSRTVAFRLVNGKYKWVGEQESRLSGRRFSTPDGEDWEGITINYSTYERPGTPKGLHIYYDGEDKRLSKFNLTMDDIAPVLRELDAASQRRADRASGD